MMENIEEKINGLQITDGIDLESKMDILGIKKSEMSQDLNISRQTFYFYKNNPDSFKRSRKSNDIFDYLKNHIRKNLEFLISSGKFNALFVGEVVMKTEEVQEILRGQRKILDILESKTQSG